MADMSDAPICPSCLHPHYPDVRCHICGHKGKGNSFRLPKFLGSDHRLHFENFNSANSNVSWSESVSRWQALSNLARIIRRDVFVTDLHIPENLEFDEHENFESTRHTIGFLGDAPVCYARWRLAEVSGSTCALLDRICVKQGYRMRGIATSALQHIMQVTKQPRGTTNKKTLFRTRRRTVEDDYARACWG